MRFFVIGLANRKASLSLTEGPQVDEQPKLNKISSVAPLILLFPHHCFFEIFIFYILLF